MNTIRQKRNALGWTLKDLARKVETDPTSVSCWENGKKQPRPTKKRKLAEAFGCSISEIFPLLDEVTFRPEIHVVPAWFQEAWSKRYVLVLSGWLNLSKIQNMPAKQIDLNDCFETNNPLEIIIIPFGNIPTAPLLIEQYADGTWKETNHFFDFEKYMFAVLTEKRILRNEIVFVPHKLDIAIQPIVGKETRFPEIANKLIPSHENHRKETLNLAFE